MIGGRSALPILLVSSPLALGSGCLLLAPGDDELVGVRPDAGIGGAAGNGGNPYAAEVLADEPIAWFRFDEGATALEAVDERGGAAAKASPFGVTFGSGGLVRGSSAAITLDGTGYLDLGNAFVFADKAPYSIEVWARLDAGDGTTRNIVVSESPSGALSGYKLFHLDDNLEFERIAADGGSNGVYPQGTFQLGVVTHLVAVFTGTELILYQNGELKGQDLSTIAIDSPDNRFRIGGRPTEQVTNLFHGALDELAIYDKVLSAQRVQDHFEAGKP